MLRYLISLMFLSYESVFSVAGFHRQTALSSLARNVGRAVFQFPYILYVRAQQTVVCS